MHPAMMMRALLVLVLALTIGSLAMARNGEPKPSRKSADDFTQNDAFWQSERGRHMSRILDAAQAGDEEAAARELETYRQKYSAPVPAASSTPRRTSSPGRVMTLPSEAR